MDAVDARKMTYAEYLAEERSSGTKHEYVDGEAYAMAGGTPEHGRLAMRFGALVDRALEGKPCAACSSDVRVRIVATGRSTYPDLSVVCGPRETAPDDPDALVNPTLIVEVLSPTTERDDRGGKWMHYQHVASLREYVLVSSDARAVEIFRRQTDGGWRYERVEQGTVSLGSIGASIELDALYRDPNA